MLKPVSVASRVGPRDSVGVKRALLLISICAASCATLPPPPPVPLPTTTPEQLGHLVVVESMQSEVEGATTITLHYTNDTPSPFRDVRLVCTLMQRDRVVNSDNVTIETAARGAEITKVIRVRDVHSRADRAECEIAGAKPDSLRAEK